MSLQFEPRIEKSSAVFDDLARMSKNVPDATLDRARRVAKALGIESLTPRNAQRVTKGASGSQSEANTDHVTADMPNPKDVATLHDVVVSPDLRSSIIEAVKRKQRAGSYANWEQSITPLRAAIDDLIEREGIQFTALHRLLGSAPAPTTSDDDKLEQMAGRSFAKGQVSEMAQRSRDINVLMKAPMPESNRRHLIAVKNFFDDATPHQRRALRKDASIIALIEELESLRLGADATASIARLLS
jgi:hypothetical protein